MKRPAKPCGGRSMATWGRDWQPPGNLETPAGSRGVETRFPPHKQRNRSVYVTPPAGGRTKDPTPPRTQITPIPHVRVCRTSWLSTEPIIDRITGVPCLASAGSPQLMRAACCHGRIAFIALRLSQRQRLTECPREVGNEESRAGRETIPSSREDRGRRAHHRLHSPCFGILHAPRVPAEEVCRLRVADRAVPRSAG